jgi:branched-chain amino acid transport system permease protein
VFLFIYTVTMVIMVITGGKGTLAGPVVGGIIFGLLPETLRSLHIGPEIQWVIYGVLMVLVVYFLPTGIVPALSGWWQARQAAPEKAATASPQPSAEAAR